MLDISPKLLEKVLYFASYIVIDPGETNLEYRQVDVYKRQVWFR